MPLVVRQTKVFAEWRRSLRDERVGARIDVRLRRAEAGNLGDVKYFEGIGEMRIDYGPGYRLYFTRRGRKIVILLCGGDKRSQSRDIERAKAIARDMTDAD